MSNKMSWSRLNEKKRKIDVHDLRKKYNSLPNNGLKSYWKNEKQTDKSITKDFI